MNESGEACACDNWICPHNEEKIAHLPGVVKGVAWLKGRVEEMRKYWQEAESSLAAAQAEVAKYKAQVVTTVEGYSETLAAERAKVEELQAKIDEFIGGENEGKLHPAEAKVAALEKDLGRAREALKVSIECHLGHYKYQSCACWVQAHEALAAPEAP